jgi:hypothetical protein
MSTQIFKKKIPVSLLVHFLEKICDKNKNNYVVDSISYRKAIYDNESLDIFIDSCMEYYHVSKQRYLERPLTYKSFITIIRQICNLHKIPYSSKIKYNHSKYDIVYTVYFD